MESGQRYKSRVVGVEEAVSLSDKETSFVERWATVQDGKKERKER